MYDHTQLWCIDSSSFVPVVDSFIGVVDLRCFVVLVS